VLIRWLADRLCQCEELTIIAIVSFASAFAPFLHAGRAGVGNVAQQTATNPRKNIAARLSFKKVKKFYTFGDKKSEALVSFFFAYSLQPTAYSLFAYSLITYSLQPYCC